MRDQTARGRGGGTEKEGEKAEGKDDKDKEALTFEPLKPTTEKPVTEEGGGKAEDQGGGSKPSV